MSFSTEERDLPVLLAISLELFFPLISLNTSNLLGAWENLIDFNIGRNIGAVDTVRRNRYETNKSISDENTRLNGLIGMMESLAYTEFATADDIVNSMLVVDDRFDAYFQNNEQTVVSLANDPLLRASVLQLRAGLKSVLDDQLSNAWRTVEIDPGRSSMSLTAYRWYGSLDNLENVVDLNPDVNAANFSKPITAITK